MSDESSQAWFNMSRAQLSERLIELARDVGILKLPDHGPVTKIEKWSVARRVVPCLIGVPESHPEIGNGEPMFTSELFFLDTERSLARSFSRWYELGEQVDPGYWKLRYPRQK